MTDSEGFRGDLDSNRDAIALAIAFSRQDMDSWSALLRPYVESFIEGNRQNMGNLVGALCGFLKDAVGEIAEAQGSTGEKVLQRMALEIANLEPPPEGPAVG